MSTRKQKLLLPGIVVFGVILAAPESGQKFRADELHAAPAGSAVQRSAGQGSARKARPCKAPGMR